MGNPFDDRWFTFRLINPFDTSLNSAAHISHSGHLTVNLLINLFTRSFYRPNISIVKLPGIITGLGRGLSFVGAGVSPNSAADK